MGMIKIQTLGSFPYAEKHCGAMKNGHAAAVAEAIEWLSGEVLPQAIKQDHELHDRGLSPEQGFGRT